jgi:hypothetical protein
MTVKPMSEETGNRGGSVQQSLAQRVSLIGLIELCPDEYYPRRPQRYDPFYQQEARSPTEEAL